MMSDGLPGDDEQSLVDWAVDLTEVSRQATGTHRGEEILVTVRMAENGSWRVSANVIGGESAANEYDSRGDAYRAFEYLVEEHGLTEAEGDEP